ncbi:MAG TPA: Cof-type HAD-IIB family hydrolase [Thermomicrobiales bacterium]|nr:Cof-type HAD-IIB family hydrolase [Thermomicrobiales bacterium]
MIRLVATDLDGTLLRGDGTVSARTRRALAGARAVGATVVLISARPPRTLRLMARDANVGGLAVCCNGALVYDLDADTIVEQAALPAGVAAALVAALRAAAPGVCFAVERGLTFGQESAWAPSAAGSPAGAPLVDDALALCAADVTKLIARHPARTPEELWGIARAVAGEAATVTHSGAPFVEIAAAGVTKARALERLCARLGVAAAEVVAFGDMPNDLPLLAWAGRGVAVANAHPAVLAAADGITRANDEDGVALVLERLLSDGSIGGRAHARAAL